MNVEIVGRHLEVDLYRIDLAGVVSKYIGETEKNLRGIFDAAERSGAMLFFDEADAQTGLAASGHADDDRMRDQVRRVVQDGCSGTLAGGRIDLLSEVEEAELLVVHREGGSNQEPGTRKQENLNRDRARPQTQS